MTRREYCERILRQVYGGMPTDDAQITINLVNSYLSDAVAIAAKQNYIDNVKLEGVTFSSNSFYTTFKNISISAESEGVWKIELPHVPVGLGAVDSISSLQFVDSNGMVSDPAIPLTANQWAYKKGLKRPQNKILYFPESAYAFIETIIPLSTYTAKLRMVSAGLSSLDSVLSVPSDYMPTIDAYVLKNLITQRNQPQDNSNDGLDVK